MLESFKAGIEAIVPVYTKNGDETLVLTETGEKKLYKLGIRRFLNYVYIFCTVDMLAQKNFFRERGISLNPPLILDGKVFIKVRVRKPRVKGDVCYGYVDVSRIHKVEKGEEGHLVVLKSGQKVKALDSLNTIGKNTILGMNIRAKLQEAKENK